jgi:predicted dehydrogenase
MSQRPWRTVLIGFGKIADSLADDPLMKQEFAYATHAQALAAHEAFDWRAVVDPSEEALERARVRWNVPILARSIEDLPADLNAEIAVVTASPANRGGVPERFPSLKAVLMEKPLGTDHAAAEGFVTRCDERKIKTQVNLWRRGDRLLRELAGGRLSALIGKPQSAFGLYGNGLYNNGSHLIDLVRMLMGEVASVQATGAPSSLGAGPLANDVMLPFSMTLARGATVALHPVDFNHYREVGLDIWGTEGRLSILQEGFTVLHYPKGSHSSLSDATEIRSDRPQNLIPTLSDALLHLYNNLAAALDSGTTLWSPASSALATEAVLTAALTSAKAGGKTLTPS